MPNVLPRAETWTKPKNVWSLRSKLEVFIWRHVVYVPKSSKTFRGILICVIFRPRDMQEYYMLFGIFTRDTNLYSLSVFYIAWTDFQYTNVYLSCVIASLGIFYKGVTWDSRFTREWHGTAALQGSDMGQPLYKHRPRLSMT